MKNKGLLCLLILIILLTSSTVWARDYDYDKDIEVESSQSEAERENQIETVNKLVLGYYQGAWKVCEILNMGNIVQDPKKIDRSIVVFNNKIYQLVGYNPLDDPDAQRTTALATIHGIDKPIEIAQVANSKGIVALSRLLESEVEKLGKSSMQKFYIVKMSGEFSNIVLQKVPDKTWLQEQLQGRMSFNPEQRYEKLHGTIIGIRMIDYLRSGQSFVWYLHFAATDKSASGIVVNIDVDQANLVINPVSELSIYIPVWTEENKQ